MTPRACCATDWNPVSAALTGGTVLSLQDEKGRTVLVPATAVAFVEIGAEESRRVGFGTL